jgi:hypothetical protein
VSDPVGLPSVQAPPAGGDTIAPTLARLTDQLEWYAGAAGRSQIWFRLLKLAVLVLGAAIPVAAALGASAAVAGVLGGMIVVLEGSQQLFHFQENWLRYRSSAESLRTEKHLYEAKAGPYARAAKPLPLLAERIESVFADERASWAADHRQRDGEAERS